MKQFLYYVITAFIGSASLLICTDTILVLAGKYQTVYNDLIGEYGKSYIFGYNPSVEANSIMVILSFMGLIMTILFIYIAVNEYSVTKNKKKSARVITIVTTLLLITLSSQSQDYCKPASYIYFSFGAGASNKNFICHINSGFNTNIIGFDASMIAHTDNINPAMFNGQLMKSFYLGNTRFSLLSGLSYQVTTFDRYDGTKTLPIVGMEWASLINYSNAVMIIRGQVTGDNFCLLIGIQGIFKHKNQ